MVELKGVPHGDERCTGTTMHDDLRPTDLTRLPEALVARDGTRPPSANPTLNYPPRA